MDGHVILEAVSRTLPTIGFLSLAPPLGCGSYKYLQRHCGDQESAIDYRVSYLGGDVCGRYL
jgi:hypothetical protein